MDTAKCPNCNKQIQTSSFYPHVIACHSSEYSGQSENIPRYPLEQNSSNYPGINSKESTGYSSAHPPQNQGWNCKLCKKSFEDRITFVSHMKTPEHTNRLQSHGIQNAPTAPEVYQANEPKHLENMETRREDIRSVVREEFSRILRTMLDYLDRSPRRAEH